MWFDLGHDGPLLDVISYIVHLLYHIISKLILHHREKRGVGPEEKD